MVRLRLGQYYARFSVSCERLGGPLSQLLVRLAVFRIFFYSGLNKLRDWDSTLLLFTHEYALPVLTPVLAAGLATAVELGASLLVFLGLGTRVAVLPLLGISAVIQFVLGARDPAYDQLQHYLWMVLLLALLGRGPGPWSLDHYWQRAQR